jgi:hypothetical protein
LSVFTEHGLEGVADVTGLQQLSGQTGPGHRRVQPRRQGPGLKADPLQREAQRREPGDQRLRLAVHLALADDASLGIHHADAGGFQRYIDPGIVLPGRLSMMLGAGPGPTPLMTPSV